MHITSLFALFVLTVSFVAAAPINNVVYGNYPPLVYPYFRYPIGLLKGYSMGSEKRNAYWDLIYKELEETRYENYPSTKSYFWLRQTKL